MTKALHIFAYGALLLASSAGSAVAAEQAAVPAPQPQTKFVDLTPGQNGAVHAAAADTHANSATSFVDLTNGTSPASHEAHSRTPHTKAVDLTSGGSPPDLNALDDEPDIKPDTIVITADRLSDPYEESNRGRFKGHVWLHRNIIDPVERSYMTVVPSPARDGLHNFLFNLETPSVLLNDVFQGDLGRAGDTVARFLVNTTLGLGGLIDVAGKTGMHYRDNDFGATLATYGVGDAPYLLVPIIGPSNPRDLGGKVVDFAIDPLHFVTLPGGLLTSVGRSGAHELDKRSVDVGVLDELAKTAPDPYAEERAAARKQRAEEVGARQ